MVLDQGYWQWYPPPSDDALIQILSLPRQWVTVCKAPQIEDPRFCTGRPARLLVWEEMPSAYRYTRGGGTRVVRPRRFSATNHHVSWRGCRSTSHGVFPICQKAATSAIMCRRCTTNKTLDSTRPLSGMTAGKAWQPYRWRHDYTVDPQRWVSARRCRAWDGCSRVHKVDKALRFNISKSANHTDQVQQDAFSDQRYLGLRTTIQHSLTIS